MGSKLCQVHLLIFSHGLAERVRIRGERGTYEKKSVGGLLRFLYIILVKKKTVNCNDALKF